MKEYTEVRSLISIPKLSGRTITGCAVRWNTESEILYDPATGKTFREIIKPSAISDSTILSSDIKMLVEGNRGKLLGRSRQGKGTLSLWVDPFELKYRFIAPNTGDGDYAVEMVSRGDINGSAISFSIPDGGCIWNKRGSVWIRTITKIDRIFSISITADPTNAETEVDVRMIAGLKDDWRENLNELKRRANL